MTEAFQNIELTFTNTEYDIPPQFYTRKFARQMNSVFPLVSSVKSKQLNIHCVPLIWSYILEINVYNGKQLLFYMLFDLAK